MTNRKTLALALALALGASMLAQPALAAMKSKITIATEGAYKPYNFKDSAGNLVGFEIDLAKELCKRIKIECTIIEQEWDGIIPGLTNGRYDAIMAGMSIKPDREKVISFSRYYAATPIRFATLKSSKFASYKGMMDAITLGEVDDKEKAELDGIRKALEGLTVGVQGSTTHESFMKEFMPGIALKTYAKMDDMILDLEAGRIDAGYTAVTYLGPLKEKNKDIVEVGPDMTGGPLGRGVAVGIRQEDKELREAFTAAINSTIKDGTLSKMAIQWFAFDASAKE